MQKKHFEENLINKVVEEFPKCKGRASLFCSDTTVAMNCGIEIARRCVMARSTGMKVLFVVDTYKNLMELRSKLEELCSHEDYNEKFLWNVFTSSYIKPTHPYREFGLIVTIGVNNDGNVLNTLIGMKGFYLVILTENIVDSFVANILKRLNTIDVPNVQKALDVERNSAPVREYRIPIKLNEDERKEYDKQTQFINDSVTIVGNLSELEKCRMGDRSKGISANDYCIQIAEKNGWSMDLDMSVDYLRQIDRLYNPNKIRGRASTTYNIIHERRKLIADCISKIDPICELIEKNPGRRILIISYHSEFAHIIANQLNSRFGNDTSFVADKFCAEFHDAIPDVLKNGRVLKTQKQSTMFMNDFNAGMYRVISINNAANNRLSLTVDMTIITSPLCETFVKLRNRFDKIRFMGEPHEVYCIYCENTVEMKKWEKEMPKSFVETIDNKNSNENYVENIDDLF